MKKTLRKGSVVTISFILLFSCIKITGKVHKEFHANNQLNKIRYESPKSKGNSQYKNYLEKVYYHDGTLKIYKRFKGRVVLQTGIPKKAITKIYDEDGDLKNYSIYRGGKLMRRK